MGLPVRSEPELRKARKPKVAQNRARKAWFKERDQSLAYLDFMARGEGKISFPALFSGRKINVTVLLLPKAKMFVPDAEIGVS